MLQCMNHLRSLNILTDKELADVSYYTPLRLLGLKPTDISTDAVLKAEGGHGVYASLAAVESAAPSVGASKL
jgi:hypothetical protein